ncbi:hypothetical protein [Aureibacter tunicatorum]|uniref:Uncharacterized protein n=1 Tax=Aureibacter tunicatorum TaxID=866807 RepID=A0AAE3XJ33_9BACT|nr:hypothetical protein [Aureibacter tunicatorum]MDR6238671.1 hypothetical protein [Aureibacter tunicatorum]BDD05398.1 hypothetical protein AUTU_28810 [Aureibacter tunicatorum]
MAITFALALSYLNKSSFHYHESESGIVIHTHFYIADGDENPGEPADHEHSNELLHYLEFSESAISSITCVNYTIEFIEHFHAHTKSLYNTAIYFSKLFHVLHYHGPPQSAK